MFSLSEKAAEKINEMLERISLKPALEGVPNVREASLSCKDCKNSCGASCQAACKSSCTSLFF